MAYKFHESFRLVAVAEAKAANPKSHPIVSLPNVIRTRI